MSAPNATVGRYHERVTDPRMPAVISWQHVGRGTTRCTTSDVLPGYDGGHPRIGHTLVVATYSRVGCRHGLGPIGTRMGMAGRPCAPGGQSPRSPVRRVSCGP